MGTLDLDSEIPLKLYLLCARRNYLRFLSNLKALAWL